MAHDPFEPNIAGLQGPPPYVFNGLKVFGFALAADLRALQAVCDKFLAIAPPHAGIRFEVIPVSAVDFGPNAAAVMVQAIDYQSLLATTDPWDDYGGSTQREVFFSFLVKQTGDGGPKEIGVFLPYIFVDNFMSITSGREVLGFNKLLAKTVVPRAYPSGTITVDFVSRVAKNDPIEPLEILRVAEDPTAARPRGLSPDSSLGMFFGPIDRLYKDSPYETELRQFISMSRYRGYSARTIIAPDGSADAHRSIIQCTYIPTVTGYGFLRDAVVRFTPTLGFDIASRFGIDTTNGVATATRVFFMDCEMELDEVKTLWANC